MLYILEMSVNKNYKIYFHYQLKLLLGSRHSFLPAKIELKPYAPKIYYKIKEIKYSVLLSQQ